jgi:hypothetical protein
MSRLRVNDASYSWWSSVEPLPIVQIKDDLGQLVRDIIHGSLMVDVSPSTQRTILFFFFPSCSLHLHVRLPNCTGHHSAFMATNRQKSQQHSKWERREGGLTAGDAREAALGRQASDDVERAAGAVMRDGPESGAALRPGHRRHAVARAGGQPAQLRTAGLRLHYAGPRGQAQHQHEEQKLDAHHPRHGACSLHWLLQVWCEWVRDL